MKNYLLTLMFLPLLLSASETSPLFIKSQTDYNKKFKSVNDQYDLKMEKLHKAYENATIQLARLQIVELKKILIAETKKANLEAAVAAREAIKLLEMAIKEHFNPKPVVTVSKLRPPVTVSKKRPPVNVKHNIENFPEQKLKFIRFTIEATNRGLACIDELEVFSGNKNVALARLGAKLSSSGDFKHPVHNIQQLNDGLYGNDKSWIVAKDLGWVQVELKEAVRINRIEWGRDRQGALNDRLAIHYKIEGALEVGEWVLLSSSADRLPYKAKKKRR